jgi:hypothetical protein
VPVTWYAELYDGDMNFLMNGFAVTTDSVNDTVQPVNGAAALDLCVQNTSNTTATVTFDLLGGGS